MLPAAIALLCLATSAAAPAQETPPNRDVRGTLRAGEWHLLGPFDNPAGAAVDVDPGLEKFVKQMKPGEPWSALGEAFYGRGGRKLGWRRIRTAADRPADAGPFDSGTIDFAALFEAGGREAENTAAYLYREILCAEARDVSIACGSDDGLRLWLNGELLIDQALPRSLDAYDERLTLRLRQGRNHLLVKVTNATGAWSFAMLSPRPATREEVVGAIDRGMRYVLDRQLFDGSWAELQEDCRGASTALAVYALVACGETPGSEPIQRALASLAASAPDRTASLAFRILALARLADPARRGELAELVQRLVSWQEENGGWSYPEIHTDLRNTELAVVALHAAARAGLEIPSACWAGAVDFTLAHREGRHRSETPGFSYLPGTGATGSMTAAGLTVLSIARDALGEHMATKQRAAVEDALGTGLAWLDEHWSVARNPRQADGHLDYLAGLERLGTLLEREQLGAHDWYAEGAEWLVRKQAADGSFEASTVATCNGLLFLVRASSASAAPATEGQDPVPVVDYAADAAKNRLPRYLPATRSSSAASGSAAAGTTDNRSWTRWLCAAGDAEPWLEIEFLKRVTARRLLFTHARTTAAENAGLNPRPARIELRFDGEAPRLIELDPDPRHKTRVELEPPVQFTTLRVRIVGLVDGELGQVEVGFTEIELQTDEPAPPAAPEKPATPEKR